MLPFTLVFLIALGLTLLSGAAATWLAATGDPSHATRKKVAERLVQIALLGAATILALLGNVDG